MKDCLLKPVYMLLTFIRTQLVLMGTSSDNHVWSVLTDLFIFGLPRGMGVYNEPVLAGESEMLTSSLVLL